MQSIDFWNQQHLYGRQILIVAFTLFFCSNTVGTYTITLPPSIDLVSGEHFIVKVCDNVPGTTINVVPQGTDKIDNKSSITLDENFGYIHVMYAEDPAGTGNNQFAILSLK
jgi:hypothetical protein